jgi:hypothetical protein
MKIILLCVAAAVLYGILHDQITARVCVEYFTIGHPPLFKTDDPTLLGIGWGIISTWWVGLLLGIPLAIVARVGSRPKRSPGSLVRPILYLWVTMAACAAVAGFGGWYLGSRGLVFLVGPILQKLGPGRHVPYITALWAHAASYIVGLVGGTLILVRVWSWRARVTFL